MTEPSAAAREAAEHKWLLEQLHEDAAWLTNPQISRTADLLASLFVKRLDAFAAARVEEERERCARVEEERERCAQWVDDVAEEADALNPKSEILNGIISLLREIAGAIRATPGAHA